MQHPRLNFVVDKFHARGHVDRWCLEHCHPDVPANAQLLKGVNSSACELLFQWLSGYKAAFRHMGRNTAQFFLLEVLDLKNEWLRQRQA